MSETSELSQKEKEAAEAISNITATAAADVKKMNDLWSDSVGAGICNSVVESVNNAVKGLENFSLTDISRCEKIMNKAKRDMTHDI